MSNPTLYEILGVTRFATLEDIKRARRDKLLENHTDQAQGLRQRYANVDDPQLHAAIDNHIQNSDAKTRDIYNAYEVLSDAEKRRAYDRSIFPDIELNARQVQLKTLRPGVQTIYRIVIQNHGALPRHTYKITWTQGTPNWAKLVLPKKQPPFPAALEIRVNTQDLQPGNYQNGIKIEIDDQLFIIPVFMTIKSPAVINCSTSFLDFGRFQPGEQSSRNFLITLVSGQLTAFSFKWRYSRSQPNLIVSPESMVDGMQVWKVKVTLNADSLNPNGNSEILSIYDEQQFLSSINLRYQIDQAAVLVPQPFVSPQPEPVPYTPPDTPLPTPMPIAEPWYKRAWNWLKMHL